MLNGSLCGLGGLTPYPVQSAMRHFPEDFEERASVRLEPDVRLKADAMEHIICIQRATTTTAPRPVDALAAKLVTLEIDGAPVTVPEGTSIMRAAASIGSDVPKLCATDTLKAFGSCRLCLVEIEGRRGYPASCTTLVADGIKVRTESPKLTQLRRDVMELYVSDHPARLRGASGERPLRAARDGRGRSA